MSEVNNDDLTITMSGRRPVKVKKSEWQIVINEKDWEGEHEFQSDRKWWIRIRQKGEKYIVYGGHDTSWQSEEDIRAGYLVEDSDKLESYIEEVAGEIKASEGFINRCIAAMPAEEI